MSPRATINTDSSAAISSDVGLPFVIFIIVSSQRGMLPCLRFGEGARFERSMSSERMRIILCFSGVDHVVDDPAFGGDVGGHQLVGIFGHQFFSALHRILCSGEFLAEDDAGSALGSHHRYLIGWPGERQVGPQGL